MGALLIFPKSRGDRGFGPTPELAELSNQISDIDRQIKALQTTKASLLRRYRRGLLAFVAAGGVVAASLASDVAASFF
jgi:hypothetical protein